MTNCKLCYLSDTCFYPFKPCECVKHRKFWDKDDLESYNFKQWRNANYHNLFNGRFELKDYPERGNWSETELFKKYNANKK